jgi:hypothetical protein
VFEVLQVGGDKELGNILKFIKVTVDRFNDTEVQCPEDHNAACILRILFMHIPHIPPYSGLIPFSTPQ